MPKIKYLRIGPRTLKTAFAVILSIIAVYFYGSSTSSLIFATMGALSAMEPTFKESWFACISQIVSVIMGAIMGVLLLSLHLPPLPACGIGIIGVITFYNVLRLKFSPTMACIATVTICNLSEVTPFVYAAERIWDTAIGLMIGMLINILIFPYDNSKQILNTIHRLDKELIIYLENMFDGNENLPNVNKMIDSMGEIDQELKIFSDQTLLYHRKKHKEELSSFLECEKKARELVVHLEALSQLPFPGVLNPYNKERLERNGAKIKDQRILSEPSELDIVTNFHVSQTLILRRELLNMLGEKNRYFY